MIPAQTKIFFNLSTFFFGPFTMFTLSGKIKSCHLPVCFGELRTEETHMG